jgi:hypothetical protein
MSLGGRHPSFSQPKFSRHPYELNKQLATNMASLEGILEPLGIHISTDSILAKTLLISTFSIALYTISKPVLSYFRLLLSLFVLPGIPVSSYSPNFISGFLMNDIRFPNSASKAPGQS